MEALDFLRQTQADVQELLNDRLEFTGGQSLFPEIIFSEIVMQHMFEVGMTFEPDVCHYEATFGRGGAKLRLSGYAYSEDITQLDLFVSLYDGVNDLTSVPDSEVTKSAERCLRFISACVENKLSKEMDDTNSALPLALIIEEKYQEIEQIRVYVLTDRVAKTRQFKSREVQGKTIKLEVMDIERLYRHISAGKPRDELVVNFQEVSGSPLPCVWVPGQMSEYDYAMTVIPGEALRHIYDKYGPRILEANVRSFLSALGKVNRGIRDTLKNEPERFMAYNNGLVIVADEVHLGKAADGSPGITWLKGMQIVNGGQTSASLYFTKKKNPEVDLSRVRIPAKLIVLRSNEVDDEEKLISDISRYANSQNAVKQSDFAANHPLHVSLENHAQRTYCPDGVSRWFYERAGGSYKVMLEREGSTPTKLKQLKTSMPPARKITKPDMAKFICIWDQKPDQVSLGAQKNFMKFMESISEFKWESGQPEPTLEDYKKLVAKAILFKAATKLIRPRYQAFQANITTYTLSLLSLKLGDKINLDRIWEAQDLSSELKGQIVQWSSEVHEQLHNSASGKMISEWAKKPGCWEWIKAMKFSEPETQIPECR